MNWASGVRFACRLFFILIQTISYIFAVTHGVLINDNPIIVLNSLAIGQNMLVYKKLYISNYKVNSPDSSIIEVCNDCGNNDDNNNDIMIINDNG